MRYHKLTANVINYQKMQLMSRKIILITRLCHEFTGKCQWNAHKIMQKTIVPGLGNYARKP